MYILTAAKWNTSVRQVYTVHGTLLNTSWHEASKVNHELCLKSGLTLVVGLAAATAACTRRLHGLLLSRHLAFTHARQRFLLSSIARLDNTARQELCSIVYRVMCNSFGHNVITISVQSPAVLCGKASRFGDEFRAAGAGKLRFLDVEYSTSKPASSGSLF